MKHRSRVFLMCLASVSMARIAISQAVPPDVTELPVVALPEQGFIFRPMRMFSSSITADAAGRLWTMVQGTDAADEPRAVLWLMQSGDGGRNWRRVAAVPTAWAAWGAIAGEPDRDVLHVAWSGRVRGARWASACYQQFDVATGRFVGDLEVLAVGKGAEDQFAVCDLGVDGDGRVAVVVSTHRHPGQPWKGGWSCGIVLRGRGEEQWSGPHQINATTHGVWTSVQVEQGRLHASYRTSRARSVIAYRSFDFATRTFDQPQGVAISVAEDGREVANASSLVVGPFGGCTIVYPSARQFGPQDGRLLLAWRESEAANWRTTVLAEDPGLRSGNVPHEHFALVRGPGRQVVALYSKQCEDFRVLYRRTIDGGRAMEEERVVARSELAGAFAHITAMRDGRLDSPVWALVSATGEGPAAGLGVRAVLAPGSRSVRWR